MLPANSNAHIFDRMIEKDKGIKRLKKKTALKAKDKRQKISNKTLQRTSGQRGFPEFNLAAKISG
ncbi:MAG: hypothetical protein U9Q66_02735 [Patescibacteria group bacterium]|nr:hypothetical protein [Patescibacteria group bacterium]